MTLRPRPVAAVWRVALMTLTLAAAHRTWGAENASSVLVLEAEDLLLQQAYLPRYGGFKRIDDRLVLDDQSRGAAGSGRTTQFPAGIYEVTVVYRATGAKSRLRLISELTPLAWIRTQATGDNWQKWTIPDVRLLPGASLGIDCERAGNERIEVDRLECRRVGDYDLPLPQITRIPLRGLPDIGPFCVANLDQDPALEVVVKENRGGHGPSKRWKKNTHPARLYAFDDDGEPLWTLDHGRGVEVGFPYAPALVYDVDGDGAGEVFTRRADDPHGLWPGKVDRVDGQEWIVKLRGIDGEELARAPWPAPPITNLRSKSSYNNNSRHNLVVAYLDGEHPALVAIRGYYGNVRIKAYDLDLKPLWEFEASRHGKEWEGAGHFISVGDLDGDGKDEIAYGGAAIDDDGTPMWTKSASHVDAVLVGDIDPDNPGLEVFIGDNDNKNFTGLVDGATGRTLWSHPVDVQTANIADRLPGVPGLEIIYDLSLGSWSHSDAQPHRVCDCRGKILPMKRFYGHDDPYLVSEAFITHSLAHWHGTGTAALVGRETPYGQYHADLIGDWREEIFFLHDGVLTIYAAGGEPAVTHAPLRERRSYRAASGGGSRFFSNAAQPIVTLDLPKTAE